MSYPKKRESACPYCGSNVNRWFWDSIDLECHPEASAKLKNGEYFKTTCGSCGKTQYEEYSMVCFDKKKGVCILFTTGDDWERFFYLDWLLDEKLRLCKVHQSDDLTEKVLAIQNGRDDRIVEMCKYQTLLKFAVHVHGFDLTNLYYSNEDGKEKIIGINTNGVKAITEFPEETYRLFDEAFRDVLPETRAKYDVYDTEWADNFISEHWDLVRNILLLRKEQKLANE